MNSLYRIVVEGDDSSNYSAYSPDVPGVVATGDTREECERELRAAIEFHLEEEAAPVQRAADAR
jgi:predicted RNase H-like HicB family nuclease